jgi:N-dimethylarginine dimethylaminohydrolase
MELVMSTDAQNAASAVPPKFKMYGQMGHRANGELIFQNKDYLFQEFLEAVRTDFYQNIVHDWFPEEERDNVSEENLTPNQSEASLKAIFNDAVNVAEQKLPRLSSELLNRLESSPSAPAEAPIFMSRAFAPPFFGDINCAYHWYMCHLGLKAAGLNIVTNDPLEIRKDVKGYDNMQIFTRDSAFILNDTAYILNNTKYFSYNESLRKIRREHFENFYNDQGLTTKILYDAPYDGGDLVYDPISTTLFVGSEYPSRIFDKSDFQPILDDFPQLNIMHIERQDDRLYHLDTMLAFLPRGEVVLNYAGFKIREYAKLADIIAGRKIIAIDENREFNSMMCNFVAAGNSVILSVENENLKQQIAQCGYDVYSPKDFNLPNAELYDGGLHCMTNQSLRYNP